MNKEVTATLTILKLIHFRTKKPQQYNRILLKKPQQYNRILLKTKKISTRQIHTHKQLNNKTSLPTSESKVVKANSNWMWLFRSHEPNVRLSEYSYFHQVVARQHTHWKHFAHTCCRSSHSCCNVKIISAVTDYIIYPKINKAVVKQALIQVAQSCMECCNGTDNETVAVYNQPHYTHINNHLHVH